MNPLQKCKAEINHIDEMAAKKSVYGKRNAF